MDKVALVTGASSGIGEAAALALHRRGYVVYAAARRADRMTGLTSHGIHALAMDVTDDAAAAAGVRQVIERSGRIDVLVNNAGYGSYGALEDVDLAEARYQFDVNVFGLARLVKLTTPHMRAQRQGRGQPPAADPLHHRLRRPPVAAGQAGTAGPRLRPGDDDRVQEREPDWPERELRRPHWARVSWRRRCAAGAPTAAARSRSCRRTWPSRRMRRTAAAGRSPA